MNEFEQFVREIADFSSPRELSKRMTKRGFDQDNRETLAYIVTKARELVNTRDNRLIADTAKGPRKEAKP